MFLFMINYYIYTFTILPTLYIYIYIPTRISWRSEHKPSYNGREREVLRHHV